MKNSGDNVFEGSHVRPEEHALFQRFLDQNDFSAHTRRAFASDMRKFATWFTHSNDEPFDATRVTVRDVVDFREHIRRERHSAVSTVNRNLVTLRRYFGWLVSQAIIPTNPADSVKELRRVPLVPKGLDRAEVRRLMREVELRQDVRAGAIFGVLFHSGCRVGDLVNLELRDLMLTERSGTLVFRWGKGGKQRSVPLPLPARRALQRYLDCRPPIASNKIFLGERGPLTDRGVRALCRRYGAITGVKLHPHLCRHTFAHQYLADNSNDLVGLAQVCGWESLNTAARYTQRTASQLADAIDRVTF